MVNQEIAEDGSTRTLKDFATLAVKHLEVHPECDEVVQLADHITELITDKVNSPSVYHALPEGFEYNFSGFWGQVIGVGRAGIRELHRRSTL